MQRIDAAAITTLRIPRLLLMEHAGLAIARVARRMAPNGSGLLAICCGPGFNGGDGLAAARHLQNEGYTLRVILSGRRAALREEPATFAAILKAMRVPCLELTSARAWPQVDATLRRAALIIDALLGIGAQGPVREPMASLIARINACGTRVLAVDIPSGLHGDTGAVQGIAVRADATVTFGLAKQGCLRGAGPALTGRLLVDSITFPRTLLKGADR